MGSLWSVRNDRWTWLDLHFEKEKPLAGWSAGNQNGCQDIISHCSSLGKRVGDFDLGCNEWKWNKTRQFEVFKRKRVGPGDELDVGLKETEDIRLPGVLLPQLNGWGLFLLWASQGSSEYQWKNGHENALQRVMPYTYTDGPEQAQGGLGKGRQECVFFCIRLFSFKIQLKEGCVMNTWLAVLP